MAKAAKERKAIDPNTPSQINIRWVRGEKLIAKLAARRTRLYEQLGMVEKDLTKARLANEEDAGKMRELLGAVAPVNESVDEEDIDNADGGDASDGDD